MSGQIRGIVERAGGDEDVLAVVVFGSYARGEEFSDIDVCLVLQPGRKLDALSLSRKKLEYLRYFPGLDVRVFQQLPLYVRVRVLKEGKVIFCREEDAMYDVAFQTVREFESYRPVYRAYLEDILHA